MRRRPILSPAAERDLTAIWVYVAEHRITAADRLLRDLRATLRLLARNPGLGRVRDELRPGLRSFPHGRYVIFYRQSSVGVEVARIVGGERDIEALFEI